ncbi:DegT/DnrJ/EryC1/StrS family aminotransferase, partial [Desulfobacterales bacterium HSG16]|nr:DegT/DnrJ/EryC1/StrS family aminotransferase [Desulfobacterales bacterium HSG16]
ECLGTNFRISELNAAVGLAQLRKLDAILETQRKYKKIIKNELGKIDHISFRTITDSDGDSATFLSFFLPDENRARKSAAALARAGVDGCFYWYDNNWHYIRKWDHLKNYQNLDLPVSDSIMSRTISMQIKLSWTEEDVKKRTETMINVLKGE